MHHAGANCNAQTNLLYGDTLCVISLYLTLQILNLELCKHNVGYTKSIFAQSRLQDQKSVIFPHIVVSLNQLLQNSKTLQIFS